MSTTTLTRVPTGTWAVDPSHSRVEFQVKHLGIATVRGHFAKFGGTLEIGEDLASAKANGTVEAASVSTNEEGRDTHLRSRRLLRRRAVSADHVRLEVDRPNGRGHLRDHR